MKSSHLNIKGESRLKTAQSQKRLRSHQRITIEEETQARLEERAIRVNQKIHVKGAGKAHMMKKMKNVKDVER